MTTLRSRTDGQLRDPAPPPYAEALAEKLRAAVEGEVRFDAGSRALHAYDASIYRQVPTGVVVPRSEMNCKRARFIDRADRLCHDVEADDPEESG